MDILRALFSSKKFIAAIVGVLVGAGARYGLHLDPADVALILSPIISYIIGQGLADLGTGAAKITAVAASAKKPTAQATAAVSEMAAEVKKKN